MRRNERYFATSKDMEVVATAGQFYMEHNPNIGMYRINSDRGMPRGLMGYSPHKKALMRTMKRAATKRER